MPTPAYLSITGVKQGLITAGTFHQVIIPRDPLAGQPTGQRVHKPLMISEDVYFTYRKIVWTHEVCGTTGSDDWRSPVAG
jgi:type VI protein secretion system component Hcp